MHAAPETLKAGQNTQQKIKRKYIFHGNVSTFYLNSNDNVRSINLFLATAKYKNPDSELIRD